MKKVAKYILSLLIVFGLVMSFSDVMYALQENEYEYEIITDTNTVRVTGYDADEQIIYVPKTMRGKLVKELGDGLFSSRTAEQIVFTESSIEILGGYVFGNCKNIVSIELPNTVTQIGDSLFEQCTSLKTITMPSSIKNIPMYTFTGCIALEEISLPTEVTAIGDYAFNNCTALKEIILPNKVQSIGEGAFNGCSQLTEITIPASVKTIDYSAFDACTSLEAINVAADNPYFSSQDGVLFNKDKSTLIRYPQAKKGTEYEVPETVQNIGRNAFKDASFLEMVTIKSLTCEVYDDFTTIPYKITIQAYEGTGAHTYATVWYGNNFIALKKRQHTIVKDAAVAATCTTAGKTEGSHCSECEEIIVEQKVVPALGHKEVIIPAVEATKDKPGLTEGSYCSVCDKILIEQKETNLVDEHTVVKDAAVAATCTKTGLTEGSHCIICKKTIKVQIVIPKKAHTYKNVVTKATLTRNGKITPTCSACKSTKSTTIIYAPKTIKLSKTSYIYNGKAQKLPVVVKDSKGKTLKNNTDYTVTYSKASKNVGKYTVKITFKGNYSGTKSLTYTINPKGTTISKLTAVKKKFTVRWRKQSSQTTGYEIQYATNKRFKSAKKAIVKKNRTTSKTISKLSARKKYYVRIRTYKTVKVNGKSTKLYSAWSAAKTVTTKR